MKIEIENSTTTKRSITYPDRKTGQPVTINVLEQKALLWRDGERYPERLVLDVPEGSQGFPVGVYLLSDQSFVINRYGKLSLKPELVKSDSVKAA